MSAEKLLTQYQFNIQIERLSSVFGEKAFSEQRLALIWRHVERLSYSEFLKIIENFLGSFRYAPLPNDFKDAAASEMRANPRKAIEVHVWTPNCFECDDAGVIVVYPEPEIESLMRCLCDKGTNHFSKLPEWSNSVSKWKKEKCPVEWFRPDEMKRDMNGEINWQTSLNKKIEYWKAKVNLAEQFWIYHSNQKTRSEVV